LDTRYNSAPVPSRISTYTFIEEQEDRQIQQSLISKSSMGRIKKKTEKENLVDFGF